MAILQKVGAADFARIYPLFAQLTYNRRPLKQDWRRLFVNHWDNPEDYFGYMLVEAEEVVGFLGLIFSRRLINNRPEKFCNITSAVVKPAYRHQSLRLFLPLAGMKEYTLTDFTPSRRVYAILRMLGFAEMETRLAIIPPLPGVHSWRKKFSLELDKNRIEGSLSGQDLKIYRDHCQFKCTHLLLRLDNDSCYLIINKTVKKKFLGFLALHYISRPDVFCRAAALLSLKLCLRFKACGLLVDQRCLKGRKLRPALTLPLSVPRLFKSEALDKADIDSLYSELLVLDI